MSSEELEIATDMAHMQRTWLAQQIAWVLIAIIIVAALLGFSGGEGPFARAVAGEEGSALWLEYDRFARYGYAGSLDIHVRAEAAGGTVQFSLPQEYLGSFQVNQIVPEPQDAAIVAGRVVYTLNVSPSTEPAVVTLQLTPTQVGSIEGVVGIEGVGEQAFRQYVFP